MAEIPLQPIKRLMKQAGAERVADDAVEVVRAELEKHVEDLTEEAYRYTTHAGRKTVKREDVEAATR